MEKDKVRKYVKKQVASLCKKRVFENKKIILFGCVPLAKDLRDELKKYNYHFSAIIDNNESKVGQECLEVKIYNPEIYLKNCTDDVAIIICSNYWREMLKQAECMGYKKNIHCHIVFERPMKMEDHSIKNFIVNAIYVKRGYDIYNKYQRKYGKDTFIFVCPYQGTGDVYMAGGYFQEYLRKEKIKNYVVLVLNSACYKIASLFQIKNIEIINQKERYALMCAYDFLGQEELKLKPLLYWGWRTKKSVIQRYCKQINFNDMFKFDVYDMKIDTEREKPIFLYDENYINDFFEDNSLRKNKTIILAPYAGSFVSDIPITFWEKLAKKFIDDGYSVCTNSVGEKEPVIKGTKGVFFDLRYAVPIVEAAGVFIGLRSGLCDIISSAKCKKIVFYENGFNASQFDFFSLKQMGLSNDVMEIIYECETDDIFLEKVLKYLE